MEDSRRLTHLKRIAFPPAAQLFESCGDDIFFAVKVLSILTEDTRKNGLLYGSVESLPNIAKAEGKTPPLAEFLQYGLDLMAEGWDDLETLLEDQVYLSGYSGFDAYVAYLYIAGLCKIRAGIRREDLIRELLYLVPLKEHIAYKRCFRQVFDPDARLIYLKEQNNAAFTAFDEEGGTSNLPEDTAAVIDLFNQVFSKMEDRDFQKLMQNVEASLLVAALPYASHAVQERFFGNMSGRMQSALREDWVHTDLRSIQASDASAAMKKILNAL